MYRGFEIVKSAWPGYYLYWPDGELLSVCPSPKVARQLIDALFGPE
jgi:hypothetical protein